jgi:UDP-glucose 4-epimerase
MAKVAIIGGSGFIGSHTAIELINHGHDVTIIDIRSLENFHVFDKVDDIIYADATDYPSILKALDNNFDYVYMLAAISDACENIKQPLMAVNSNIVSLVNVLHAVSSLNIPRIIFSSTVWVYSVCDLVEVDEESNLSITNSDHIYTTCKLTCEALIKHYHQIYNIQYTILRYGIAYGPGCHPDTVLSRFMTNAINGEPLVITGDGSIYRNFLNVMDHARGNRLAMTQASCNQIINLEGPEKITLTRVAERVKELHGDVDIIYTDQRSGDYVGRNVSNQKAEELLNWMPIITFDNGTLNMYNNFISK